MKEVTLCEGCGLPITTAKIEAHYMESFGVPVTLYNTAEETKCGCAESTVRVPMPKKLIQAVALYRVTVASRLNGSEIKFIRTTLDKSAKDFAEKLSVDASTLSRWENGSQAISVEKEKFLRMHTVRALQHEAEGIKAELEDILEMNLKGFPVEGKFLEMGFTLSRFKKKNHYADIEIAA